MGDITSGLIWLVVLLLGNAFFVAAEFAVIAAKRSQIEPLVAKGTAGAKTAIYAMDHVSLMLATSQLGITVCSLLILNISEPALHKLFEIPLQAMNLDPSVISVLALVITILLVSYLHVVFGEMIPKNISFSVPDKAVLILALPLVFFGRIFKPIIWFLNSVANLLVRAFGMKPREEAASAFTLEEVETIVQTSTKEGALSDTTGALSATFEFTSKLASDVVIDLSDIISFEEGVTPAQIEKAVAQHGFSRYVVMDESLEPYGYVHLKDIISISDREKAIPSKLIRHLDSVYAGTELEDALAKMREDGVHVAKVFDELGKTIGVLFLEDIIEELVGEVQDATRRRSY